MIKWGKKVGAGWEGVGAEYVRTSVFVGMNNNHKYITS